MWPIWLALLAWVVGLIEGGPNAASTLSSEKLLQQQLLEQQQLQRQRDQQAVASPLQRRIASAASRPRALAERPTRAEEFNITGVLQPEYQIRATLKPNDKSQFYYLSPKTGPAPMLLVSPCSGPISWSVSYVGPPESDQNAEGQAHWPVKQLIPSSPLFEYEGAETRNFTIPVAQANLYRIEMRPVNSPLLDLVSKTRSPNTVLLYATSDARAHLPGGRSGHSRRHLPQLEFQQKWSRRRLIVSWNKSHAEPEASSYLLAVTSGVHLHPPTLCAAENILRKHPCPSRLSSSGTGSQHFAQHRTEPEGLHCVHRSKLTLFGLKYNTTYHFTLYIMNVHTNVSSRVAMESFRFQRKPPIVLQSGRYTTTNLRKSDGFAIFRYRPKDNTTTLFNILACGACSVKVKFRAPGYFWESQIGGEYVLRAPALPPGKKFSIQIAASQLDLVRMSKVKILAADDENLPFADYLLSANSATSPIGSEGGVGAWEYRTLRKCRAKPASWCSSISSSATNSNIRRGRRGSEI